MPPKIIIFIPTRNTATTLKKTYQRIPECIRAHAAFIVVDNASSDSSVAVAHELGLPVIQHEKDRGYGGSNKTAFDYAQSIGADILVVLHSDCQYDPRIMNQLLAPVIAGEADVVFGSRIMGGGAMKGGMPWWKYIANRFLTWIENRATGGQLSEYHSGYRIYTMNVLKRIAYNHNSDNWIFDSEIIFQIINAGFSIKELPIPTTYSGPISSISFFTGVVYGLSIFWLILKFKLHQWNIIQQKQFR